MRSTARMKREQIVCLYKERLSSLVGTTGGTGTRKKGDVEKPHGEYDR